MNYFDLQKRFIELKNQLYTRLVRPSFGAMGKGCVIQSRMRCTNPKDIHLGDRVFIGADAWIDCFRGYAGASFNPRLEIGNDTTIGYHSHIMVVGHLRIGKHVLIADKVYISDNAHSFEDVHLPVAAQPLQHRPVEIEDEAWLGENVCVLPGVRIGRHAVVGANSVVNRDVPAFSVVAGVPARVIRQYDASTAVWQKVSR